MTDRWVLQRYFGRIYLFWFLVFLCGLSGIIFLFEVAELVRRASGHEGVGFGVILTMGFYKLPETVERILAFVTLFAGLFTFWRLTRSQELIVARSVGVSAWQFVRPAFLVTLAFSLLNIAVLNPLGAGMNSRYKEMESLYLERSPTFELTGAGLWLRQKSDGKSYLVHADHVDMNPLTLAPVIVFIYNDEGGYLGRVDAPEAVLRDGVWDLRDAWINMDQQVAQKVDRWTLATTLTMSKIQESMAPPNAISFWELPRFIDALKTIGLPPTRHQLAFQSILSQPLALCAMVLFAAACALRMSRRGGVLPMILMGVLIGIFAYALNNVVLALGTNQTLPVVLAAWAMPVVMFALANALLLHLEES